ncbi:hypothetical protein G7085_20095 [Tessaracoccus sp. HDW20]|uniref:hypothetical protein n=1 Tax=Tessaracoccus coleopterorum TaxID=2714950 RepID=UPI0018D4C953|nr:hypothetical protein [Tessaracoccus coleopterorum]NHB86054.1 hypothetical protein [Tessaracoccus coleopterorum]
MLPTVRELNVALPRLREAFGHGAVGSLASENGRSARYRAYLAASRGRPASSPAPVRRCSRRWTTSG